MGDNMVIVMQTKIIKNMTKQTHKRKKQWCNVGTMQIGNKKTKKYHEYLRAMTEKDDATLFADE